MRAQRGSSVVPRRAGRAAGLRDPAVDPEAALVRRSSAYSLRLRCWLWTQRAVRWAGARFRAACLVLSVREAIADLRYHIDLPRC